MFWKNRLDMRAILTPLKSMSDDDLQRQLATVCETVSDKLTESSVFRNSKFPEAFKNVQSVHQFHEMVDDLYDFAFEEKVWLGIGP